MTIATLLAPLQTPVLTLAGASISVAEVLGFGTGAVCVWLVAKQHLLNWPIGIANNLLFILLFATTGLYADAGLQVVYIALACYGWWSWTHGAQAGGELAVSHTPARTLVMLLLAGATITFGLTALLDHVTDSTVPFWDALTTALSLVATYGQCRKQVESWYFWMLADVIYVPLYASKGLWLTALLYVGFFMLCVMGWRRWVSSTKLTPALTLP
jgi:nicotinamide mononucleotide transporter